MVEAVPVPKVAPRDKYLPLSKVLESTSLSKSTVYLQVKNGQFPKPVKLSQKRVAWLEREVLQWMESKQAQRPLELAK